MLETLQTLDQWFISNRPSGKPNKIIHFIVIETLKRLEGGQPEPIVFNRDNFVAGCHPGPNQLEVDASKWVPRTKDLQTALNLSQISNEDGKTAVLRVDGRGGKGNISQFWLVLEVMPTATQSAETLTNQLDIAYRRTAKGEVKPTRLLRWLLKDGELRNRSHKGIFFLSSIMLMSVIWILMFAVSLLGMWLMTAPLSIGHLVKLLVSSAVFWLVWREFYQPWWRLIDDRVITAPQWVVTFAEDTCQLEMHRHEGQKWVRLVRFTADCPLCGGSVELMPGKPDHHLPLVGRCLESPHYHVFSFDRSHLLGTYIGPPLPAALKSPASVSREMDTQRIEKIEPAIAS